MVNILFNALASTAGGGLTYLRNILPRLSEVKGNHHFVIAIPESTYDEFQVWQNEAVTVLKPLSATKLRHRLWWEQTGLRRFLRQQKIALLISLGNFAILRPSVPQILFSRNALYYSPLFTRDLRQRRAWQMLAGHLVKSNLAKLSLRVADYHVAPTVAMADYLLEEGVNPASLRVLPFGFDSSIFVERRKPLVSHKAETLKDPTKAIRLLYVSHYNYFRNFETLLRALPLLKEQLKRPVQLVLTTELKPGAVYGGYRTDAAFALIERLRISPDVRMLGSVEYDQLFNVYQNCDLFVCPSYAESFGHPLLEAMAAKLPIVAANLPVHREICQEAAIYFDVFDERQLAAQVTAVLNDSALREKMVSVGCNRVQTYSWDAHLLGLMSLIEFITESSRFQHA